jgi:hypothetical protein
MTNFNELTDNAAKVADARTKAYTELKKAAPEYFRQFAEAMKNLGYVNTYFRGKLFHDQATFNEFGEYDNNTGASLVFDFREMKFQEATDEKMNGKTGNLEDVYDGGYYELDFSSNTYGKKLLEILKSLPARLKTCTEKAESEIKAVNEFLTVQK